MKIKMLRNWKPHYKSKWMTKNTTYNSDFIVGKEESAKRAISFGFAVEVKDPRVKAIGCGESVLVKKSESRQVAQVKSEMTKEQMRDEIRTRSQQRKEQVKDRILAKIRGEEAPVVEEVIETVEADAIEVPVAPVEEPEEERNIMTGKSRRRKG